MNPRRKPEPGRAHKPKHEADLEAAIARREANLAQAIANLQGLQAKGGEKHVRQIAALQSQVEALQKRIATGKATLEAFKTGVQPPKNNAETGEKQSKKDRFDANFALQREVFNAETAGIQAKIQANPAKTRAELARKAREKLPQKPRPAPSPPLRTPIQATTHAVERYLERVCGCSEADIRAFRRLGIDQRHTLWEELIGLLVPPEVWAGLFRFWTSHEERLVCVPGSHTALVKDHTVVSVMGWPNTTLPLPLCLQPYLDERTRQHPDYEPPYRVHSPLGLHRAVKISAAHRFGTAAVGGVGCEVLADMVRAEARDLPWHEDVARVAWWYSLTPQQVRDALDYMALPGRVREQWTKLGFWEMEQYWAQSARKDAV